MVAEKAKIVTELAPWVRVKKGDDFRYFSEAIWPQHRSEYADCDPTGVNGIGVYDTRVSSVYAIAVFGDYKAAEDFALPSIKKATEAGEKIARKDEVASDKLAAKADDKSGAVSKAVDDRKPANEK